VVSWLWIKTSLDLFQWFKLEEVYSNLYIVKCTGKTKRKRGIGNPIKKLMKYAVGGGILLLLLLLIIAPILLFSSLNPMAEVNPVKKSYMELTLEFDEAFSFELFRTTRAELLNIDMKEYENIKKLDTVRRADLEQIQAVKFPKFSDSYIFPTDNVRKMIIETLQIETKVYIDVKFTFIRSVNTNS